LTKKQKEFSINPGDNIEAISALNIKGYFHGTLVEKPTVTKTASAGQLAHWSKLLSPYQKYLPKCKAPTWTGHR
jgi:hypothetical protein